MLLVSVEDLKKHLNVDHNEDDAYIGDLAQVAQDAIATYLQRPIEDFIISIDGDVVEIKPAIRHSIRLLVGQWYANREPVAFANAQEIPFGLNALLVPLKNFAPSVHDCDNCGDE